jgi:hypothetical protein
MRVFLHGKAGPPLDAGSHRALDQHLVERPAPRAVAGGNAVLHEISAREPDFAGIQSD